jgi:acetyl/propionyl-CoA carboxylase alpha subunit
LFRFLAFRFVAIPHVRVQCRVSHRTSRLRSRVRTLLLSQVTRNDIVVKGKLLQQLSEGKTANPRWLVAFVDEPSWKDEELYEAVFGKHWPKETDVPQKQVRSRIKPPTNVARKKTSKNSTVKSSPSSDAEASQTSSTKKKSVTFTETSAAVSEGDSSPREKSSSRSSAREQRSKRRQAQVEKEVVVHHPTTMKRTLPPPTRTLPDNKKARKDEEVIKVPMLTGTLYLYRGPVRRAEFVRHV